MAMATASKDKRGERAPSPPAVPPRAAPGSAWPGALRIDVELAENHARRRMVPAELVTGGIGLRGSRRKASSTYFSTAAKNDLRPNNHAEITTRRLDDDSTDSDDMGKKVRSGAAPRTYSESLPLQRANQRGFGREKSKHGGAATRSTDQKKQHDRQRSVFSLKKKPSAVDCGVEGDDTGSACDARMSTTSEETRKGEGSTPNGSNSDNDGDTAVVGPITSIAKHNCYGTSTIGASGTAAAMVASLDVTAQHGGIGTHESSAVEDGRKDKIRVDERRSTGLLSQGKDGDDSQTSCGPTGIDVEQPRRPPPSQAPVSMGQVALLMQQVRTGMQMVVAVTSAASKAQDCDDVPGIITAADSEAAPPPATARASEIPITVGRVASHKAQQKPSSPASLETDATSLDLRKRYVEIRSRCQSSLQTLQAASAAIAGPGEKLRRSFEAYCHAHRSLQETEASVRYAEEQEAIAVANFRRASEAILVAQMELGRAGAASREINDVDSISSCPSASLPSSSLSENSSNKSSNEESSIDDDNDSDGEGSPARPASSLAAAAAAVAATAEGIQEKEPRQTKRNKHNKAKSKAESASKRPRLVFAIEIARDAAERALAEKRRAETEADSALILVGALTAGDWTLAIEACDTARAVYEKVAQETVPKLQEFRDGVRLFRHLSRLMINARWKLYPSRVAWEAVSRGGGGGGGGGGNGGGCDEQDVLID